MAALQRLALRGTPKATKQAARYTPAGGVERCGMCRHYVPSSSCARIEGPVSAAGWCQLYSQQVTWRPRAGQAAGGSASLDLSFLAPGALPAGLTFTRASTGTYFDSSGTMQTAAINAPRWDYDPVTHALRGVLIEEQRTNTLWPSLIPGGAAWAAIGATTVTANAVIAPDGTTTAGLVAANTTASDVRGVINAIAPGTNGTTVTLSAFVKTTSGANCYFQVNAGGAATAYFDLTAGTGVVGADLGAGITNKSVTISPYPNGWYRVSYTLTPSATGGISFYIGPCTTVSTSGDNRQSVGVVGQGIYIWGAQVEQGAFPTSYIPTTSAAVTRAADVATMPTSTWFNAVASSLAADFIVAQSPNPSFVNSRSPTGLGAGTDTNVIRLWGQLSNSSVAAISTAIAGVNTNSASLGNTTANAVMKLAGAWNGTTAVGSLNGAAAVSQSIGMPAGLNTLTIGDTSPGSTNYINGWVRRVRYWNRALSAAELQSVTT